MKKLIVTLLVINITLISCANGQIEKKMLILKQSRADWATGKQKTVRKSVMPLA